MTLGNTVEHLLCLVRLTVFLERAGSDAHQVEDIAILPDEGTVRLAALLGRLIPCKTAEVVFDIVTEPRTAEAVVTCNAPVGQLGHIHLDMIIQREQKAGNILVLERGYFLESGSVQQDAFFCEDAVDAIHPFGQVTTAALQNKTFLAVDLPQILRRDAFDIQSCIPPSISSMLT